MIDIPKTAKNGETTLLSHVETDELLARVNHQISQGTFDKEDQQLILQMVEGLGDTRGMVRLGFAEALGKIGKPAVEPLIDALLHHANVVVRRAAAKTLTLIGDPQAVPHLVYALLNDEDTVVQGSSIGALARTGEASVSSLLEILASSNSSESHKGHAAWALAFIGAKAKDRLYTAYDSDSPEVRAAVVGAISKVAEENRDDTKAMNLLLESLQDSSANVRSEAAAVLGNLKYKGAIPKLTDLLNHEVGETRKSAALSLMKICDRVSIEPLKAALDREADEEIKKAIILAISMLERQSETDDW
ncbi:HEAT repeat domain-containing protein [Waterburya agarophytonicola K14]|uniref:HEAT repeat domain-containing protein n=1 Tax=Waterburya agarophytonicola KI4 TaxID=2874699 RepID=A0A964BQI6_9CYAN|nr:HEAT repeat domain-containing protein [Waterburya agarophytonicola]MCC0177739.1 HEAT repeat domain-containing protein [Waterburya agarophytonicola KI4]